MTLTLPHRVAAPAPALRCKALDVVAGPHSGCAEFAPAEEHPCGRVAVKVLALFPSEVSVAFGARPRPYALALCEHHAAQTLGDTPVPGYSDRVLSARTVTPLPRVLP